VPGSPNSSSSSATTNSTFARRRKRSSPRSARAGLDQIKKAAQAADADVASRHRPRAATIGKVLYRQPARLLDTGNPHLAVSKDGKQILSAAGITT
jgi:hypothetical protein